MPTTPDHVTELLTHLRILHKREFDTVEEYEQGTSTYSQAADLIEVLLAERHQHAAELDEIERLARILDAVAEDCGEDYLDAVKLEMGL